MWEIYKQEIGKSRILESVGNQKKQEIRKSRKSEKVGNQKKEEIGKVGNQKN